ncbi:hypothetical protein RKD55_004691 [Rossellomorea marisflavi]
MVYSGPNGKLISLIICAIVTFCLVLTIWIQAGKKAELTETHESLISKLNTVENDIRKRQAELDQKKTESVKEATGFDPALIQSDSVTAESYFKPAFSWKSGKTYDKARNQYIDTLGKDNAFTKTYLPPDTKIDTDDGPLSYIDFKGLKATFGDIHVVPVSNEGDRVRYVAFVQYFMHRSDQDLVNPGALEKSEAIIEFTAAGDRKKGERIVTEVTAKAGFQSTLKP